MHAISIAMPDPATHPGYNHYGRTPSDELARRLELEPESFSLDELRAVGARLHELAESHRAAVETLDAWEIEPGEECPAWVTLDDFLQSRYWDEWQGEHEARLAFRDPERYNRILEAATDGADGSTHGERIEDIRAAVDDYARDEKLAPYNLEALRVELDELELWHDRAGTLNETTG